MAIKTDQAADNFIDRNRMYRGHRFGGRGALADQMSPSIRSDRFKFFLYERPLRGDWKLLGSYTSERAATQAMLDLPARACDYLIRQRGPDDKGLAAPRAA